jgi:single-strand DNA-binding protein
MEIKVKGRVGNDPELKFVTQEQLPLATFNLAYTPRSKKGNEWVDGETMWFRVAMFGKKAEAIVDAVKKGDEVLVLGALRQSTYKAKDGTDKNSLEINATEVTIVPKVQKTAKDFPNANNQLTQEGWGNFPW